MITKKMRKRIGYEDESKYRNMRWKGSEAGKYKEIKLFVFVSIYSLIQNSIIPQKLTGFLILPLVLAFLMYEPISLSSEELDKDKVFGDVTPILLLNTRDVSKVMTNIFYMRTGNSRRRRVRW